MVFIIKKERKKERKNHVICSLPHGKRKEKKAEKSWGKQAGVTMERFLQVLSSSAWLYIFLIYIDSNNEQKEKQSERVSIF